MSPLTWNLNKNIWFIYIFLHTLALDSAKCEESAADSSEAVGWSAIVVAVATDGTISSSGNITILYLSSLHFIKILQIAWINNDLHLSADNCTYVTRSTQKQKTKREKRQQQQSLLVILMAYKRYKIVFVGSTYACILNGEEMSICRNRNKTINDIIQLQFVWEIALLRFSLSITCTYIA